MVNWLPFEKSALDSNLRKLRPPCVMFVLKCAILSLPYHFASDIFPNVSHWHKTTRTELTCQANSLQTVAVVFSLFSIPSAKICQVHQRFSFIVSFWRTSITLSIIHGFWNPFSILRRFLIHISLGESLCKKTSRFFRKARKWHPMGHGSPSGLPFQGGLFALPWLHDAAAMERNHAGWLSWWEHQILEIWRF